MVSKTTYTTLLGYDPREDELARRKLWAGMYGAASSPYEKIGLGLSQLGGALFDRTFNDETADPVAQINKVATDASQQFEVNSPEYFNYIAANVSNPTVRQNAAALAREAEVKATKQTREDIEFVGKNPDQLATELQTLTDRLERKARTLGWKPEDTLNQEVPPEIQAKLEKTPEYKKILQLSSAGQTSLMDRAQKEEKEGLTIESLKTTIAKNKADLNKIGTDFDAGTRWNYERDSAIKALAAAGYKPDDELKGADKLNTALVSTQKVALREPWQAGKQPAGVIKLK
jgi:hypothetical protein